MIIKASVHRFRDSIATYIGTGETVYMTPEQAERYGRALIAAAKSCKTESFQSSTFDPVEIQIRN